MVVFGLVSAKNLGVDLLPTVNIPVVVVTTTFPGASPSVVEQQISQVIESTVSPISNVTILKSTSILGASRVIISFDPNSDANADTNQVASLVSAVTRSLPLGASPPSVQTYDPTDQPILRFGILAAGTSLVDVGDYVSNDLTPLLERVNGVANIQIDGAPTRTYEVLLDPNRLVSFGINPQQVTAAISGSAINQSIGTVSATGRPLLFPLATNPRTLPISRRSLGSIALW